jgi:hypothetical protein
VKLGWPHDCYTSSIQDQPQQRWSDPEIVVYLKAADTAMNAALNDASVFLEKQEG